MLCKKGIFLLIFALSFVQCQDEMLICGEFVMTIVNGSELAHSSGIIGYNPHTNAFNPDFGGGIFSYGRIPIYQLAATPIGVYGTGPFLFVGDEMEYSSAVVKLNTTTNTYEGMNGGIWNVDYPLTILISWIGNSVVFAGTFSYVESLSLPGFLEGVKKNLVVPHIVKVDSNNNYSTFNDPNNVFSGHCSGVTGLANTLNGDKLFIYCSKSYGLYYLDESNDDFILINTFSNLTNLLSVDSQDNLYIPLKGAWTGVPGTLTCYLGIFNASTEYSVVHYEKFSCNCGAYLIAAPYKNGTIVNFFNGTDCTSTVFEYFDPESGQMEATNIPPFTERIGKLIAGSNNDLWGLGNYQVYYYSSSRNEWANVNFYPFNNSTLEVEYYDITWDSVNNCLLVSILDNYASNSHILKVTTENFPPSNPEILTTNSLANYGQAWSTTTIKQPNSTNYDYYVGGIFNRAGNGVVVNNCAKYSDGVWSHFPFDSNSFNPTNKIRFLTSHGQNLFYAADYSFGGFDTQHNISIITNPEFNGIVHSICATDTMVYYAGDFSAQLQTRPHDAYALIAYNLNTQQWISFGIPEFSSDETISSLSTNFVNGANYLVVAGNFYFTISGVSYKNIAFLNMDTNVWSPNTVSFGTNSLNVKINDALLDNTGTIYMAGTSIATSNNYYFATANFTRSAQPSPVGQLTRIALVPHSIALFTDQNSNKFLFSTGTYSNSTNSIEMIYSPIPSAPVWHPVAGNLLYDYFAGDTWQVIYSDGSKGLNGVNP